MTDRPLAWFFQAAPAARLAVARIAILGFSALYVLLATPLLLKFGNGAAFRPIGVVSVLTQPLPLAVAYVIHGLCVVSGACATLGLRYSVSAPVFASTLLWVTSYRNSWGMIFHTENLFVIHALVLACCPQAAHCLTPRSVTQRRDSVASAYGWPLRVLSLVTVATYLIAGVAKLQHAGVSWAMGHEIRTHIAYDAVRKIELGSGYSRLGVALVPHAWVFAPLSVITLMFELGAPLALLGGRLSRVWCLACWLFHVNVLLLMWILFPYPLIGIAYASFFELEKPWAAIEQYVAQLKAAWRGR
jgi:hypothetical protein